LKTMSRNINDQGSGPPKVGSACPAKMTGLPA